MKFIQWLKSLFTKKESEEMSDQSVTDTAVADATTVAATDTTATTSTADTTTVETATTDTGIVATVERDLSQFYDVVKELTERFGAEYKELAIDFAKAVSVKK
ncbi:hypothetical protein [Tatumella citrea]|uniref:Uncharacterized protein n=1 Tax=Tatumella citrea TaxID=53336 RepID=A0A1Y0LKJ6_TATCI|nr:hypothetical protein [Tatumella citrea]ARU94573.1 hypothetical protein A7K98_12855 [Tatumella citrea]ARU98611.1 hypothetical protein A7K99_12845 [Tatumella citrea]